MATAMEVMADDPTTEIKSGSGESPEKIATAKEVKAEPTLEVESGSGESPETQDVNISGVNLHLLRYALPLDPETLRMHAASYADYVAKSHPRTYVDNHCNVVRERVGAEVECSVAIGSLDDLLEKVRADPFKDHKASRDKAKVAAYIYAREIAEYERGGRNGYKPYSLKTKVQLVAPRIRERRISPRDVTLYDRIGGGGFGVDSLGSLFGEIVAVREIHQKQDEIFAREMRASLRLSHPNVVKVLGLCRVPEKLLVVMEYTEMSLSEAVHARKIQMGDDVKLDLMAQLWGALDYLHRFNVAHCDIKTDNVRLQNVAEGGMDIIAKLTDFGNAIMSRQVFFGPAQDLHVTKCRSPRYSSPEFLHEMPMSFVGLKAADVYALAVTCYELSTEQTPFSYYSADQEKFLLDARRQDVWDSFRPSACCVPLTFGCHAYLEECWNPVPRQRPAAHDMVILTESLLHNGAYIFNN